MLHQYSIGVYTIGNKKPYYLISGELHEQRESVSMVSLIKVGSWIACNI